MMELTLLRFHDNEPLLYVTGNFLISDKCIECFKEMLYQRNYMVIIYLFIYLFNH
jgi:hypothetical protein